ncbi:MAG TPA: hypothetical protein VK449_08630, partial [Anaerolineales bacterium]|nr:hypothetical protein [Anaerolineales bacterium]
MDFEAVLDDEIAAGQISEGEGLIRLLKSFLGDPEAALPEAYGTVQESEGNGVIERANDYLARGEDEQAKGEIEQLLNALVPTTEQLKAYSQPAPASALPDGPAAASGGLAAPASQTDCTSLWRAGFPMAGVTRYPCFEYIVGSVPGAGSYTIYYPTSWGTDDPGHERLQAAADAAADAMRTYLPFGDIGPVNIIFSTFESPAGFLAEVYSHHARDDEACPLLIYPRAMAETDEDQFKQSVAHEIFHCFQVRHLRAQMLGTDREVRKWWSEASAEYFSNVVYPTVNYEQRHEDSFDAESPEEPLTDLGYEDAVFFQYLGTRIGNAGVIDLLRSMPADGGEEEQVQALAGYTDIKDLFHEFGRAYLEGRIEDTGEALGGGTFPVNPTFEDELHLASGATTPVDAEPFVLRRLRVTFEDEQLYTLTTEETGVEGRYGLRLGFGDAAWGPVPETLNTACANPPAVLLLTNTTPGLGTYTVQIGATTEESGECDRCLLGNWQMDLDSYRSAFDALSASYMPGGATLSDVTGSITALFLEGGHVYSSTEGFTAVAQFSSGGQPAQLTMTMNGTVDSIYVVEGPGRISFLRPVENLTTD